MKLGIHSSVTWNKDSYLIRPDAVVYFLNADLPSPDIPTVGPHVRHAHESQLSEVTVLHARRHERHWDISLNSEKIAHYEQRIWIDSKVNHLMWKDYVQLV